jgi:hypothetical protein
MCTRPNNSNLRTAKTNPAPGHHGNLRYFSVGANLNEIRQLSGADAFEFARVGQSLIVVGRKSFRSHNRSHRRAAAWAGASIFLYPVITESPLRMQPSATSPNGEERNDWRAQ